ncbi:30S ribosomal protein S17 [Candidatus Uhrbacteria bacterium]|nr:30S ribosomal protein S17 [Candidatus Uhrbacteria bacterium]
MTTHSSSVTSHRRRLQGIVVSIAMKSTTVVRVDRQVAHEKYGKYFVVSKKFKIHDPAGASHVGDTIEFEECRPISRDKCWRYLSTVKSSTVL